MEPGYVKVCIPREDQEKIVEEQRFDSHEQAYKYFMAMTDKYRGLMEFAQCERSFDDYTLGQIVLREATLEDESRETISSNPN